MVQNDVQKHIKNARDILVGKVPDPKSQVDQITLALMYKFMDDMDISIEEMDGKPTFFTGEYEKYAWHKIMDIKVGNQERMNIYEEALKKLPFNEKLPPLFREIFKNAFLPYRDPNTLTLFLKEISYFNYDNSERLGDAFEHLLSVLSSQGDAGMFRTPRHIIDLIVKVVDPDKNSTILDPACGTAGFLISAYKHIQSKYKKLNPDDKKKISENLVGYDISPDMVRLSLVNMYLHGFKQPKITEYDTLSSDSKWNDFFDVILANPPFMTPRGGSRPHSRFEIKANRSEVLFVDYIMEHLTPNGKAGVIVPEGIIFTSSNAYKDLRKMLVNDNYLYAVVSLPAGVFNPYAGVKTSILFLDKNLAKRSKDILFVKIENDGFDLGAQRRRIDQNDLPQALQIIKDYQKKLIENKEYKISQENSKLTHLVSKEKIKESGDYNLSGDRYRESIDSTSQKWPIVGLGTLSELFADGNWIERKDQSEKGIRLIQTGNVGIGEYLNKPSKSRFISEATFKRLKCTEIFKGDILVSRLPDPVGRTCIVPKLDNRMITAVDCTIIRFDKEKVISKYFLYYSKSTKYFSEVYQYLTGASRQRISRSNLAKVKITLPPLKIQKQIVEEIDGYQKIMDGAEQVINNWQPKIVIDPEWKKVKLKKVGKVKMCKRIFKDQTSVDGDIPFYKIGTFGKTPDAFITQELFNDYKSKFSYPKKGDVLISTSGTIGRTVIFDDVPAYFQDSNIVWVENDGKIVSNNYLHLVFQNINWITTKGGTIERLYNKLIEETDIFVPSLKIQKQIVKKIEAERALIKSTKKLIEIYEKKIKEKVSQVWGN